MSKTTISKKFLSVSGNNEVSHLKVELYYDKGGANYFTGGIESRGLKLSVSPVNRQERENGIVIESYVAFSGFKKLVKEMARFNQKACETFVLSETEEKEMIDVVLNHNNLKLI